jgi:pyruvate dehydrogenase E2 component (dihydrolipoamide acetyltransferase)
MGEGLQEVQIIEFKKHPGDHVGRDELLYTMETDKALMEVESPFAGVLKEWLAAEGDVVPIGGTIGRIDAETQEPTAAREAAGTTPEAAAGPDAAKLGASLPPVQRQALNATVPPRTRAYCRELGLSDEEIAQIPAASGKLMPDDVDAYMKRKNADPEVEPEPVDFVERALTQEHRVFIYRLKRSAQLVVPAVIKRRIPWAAIRTFASGLREGGGDVQPTSFQTFSYCLVQAVKEHPKFRSALIGDATVREYAHVNVGIAVGGEGGKLTIAVVPNADTLTFPQFVEVAKERIQRARNGEDQADENTQIHLTYMGAYDVVDAIPVLVAPAVAVMFIGSAYEHNGELMVNLVLTFDHRLIQGIEAAEFMVSVAKKVAELEQIAVIE